MGYHIATVSEEAQIQYSDKCHKIKTNPAL